MPYTYPVATGVYRRPRAQRPQQSDYSMEPSPPRQSMARVPGAASGALAETQGYLGDPLLAAYRTSALADASARTAGARLAARNLSPNDPSLAAYGGLEALLRGQGDASRGTLGALSQFLQMREGERWQEYMLRLQAKLAEEQQKRANRGSLAGDIFGTIGQLGGAFLGGI